MNKRRMSVVVAAAALASAVAGNAYAADKASKPMDFTVKAEPATAQAPAVGQITRYDASKGRFGITLNVQQFTDRPATANDVQAGAYFRITPSLRVGGSVALGDQKLVPGTVAPVRPADAPRVRLESTFKF